MITKWSNPYWSLSDDLIFHFLPYIKINLWLGFWRPLYPSTTTLQCFANSQYGNIIWPRVQICFKSPLLFFVRSSSIENVIGLLWSIYLQNTTWKKMFLQSWLNCRVLLHLSWKGPYENYYKRMVILIGTFH